MIPDAFAEEVKRVREGGAYCARPELSTLELLGPDRLRFLNGMVTNDLSSLAEGQGVLAVKASNKGRVEGLLRVRAGKDRLWIDLRSIVAPKVFSQLERHIIMDDCQVRDVSEERRVMSLVGSDAGEILVTSQLNLGPLPSSDNSFVAMDGGWIVRDRMIGVPGFELHVVPNAVTGVEAALKKSGACEVSPQALEVVRIEEGVPIDGAELSEDVLVLEARLDAAISFRKGCYLGQEVIARGSILGQVNHRLSGFTILGPHPPPLNSPLFLPEEPQRKVGELTSLVCSPKLGWIGLGYLRREIADGGERRLLASDVTLSTRSIQSLIVQ